MKEDKYTQGFWAINEDYDFGDYDDVPEDAIYYWNYGNDCPFCGKKYMVNKLEEKNDKYNEYNLKDEDFLIDYYCNACNMRFLVRNSDGLILTETIWIP